MAFRGISWYVVRNCGTIGVGDGTADMGIVVGLVARVDFCDSGGVYFCDD